MAKTASFTRIALTAAPVFLAQGYAAVSVRALADRMGIKAASLYHHCPGGKAELYVRSLSVFLADYRSGVASASGRAAFPNSLLRMADWMVLHPPVDMGRVQRVDLPHLDESDANALIEQLHDAVLAPVAAALEVAKSERAVKRDVDVGLAAASVVSLVDGLGFSHLPSDREATADEVASARRMVRAGLKLLMGGIGA